MTDCSTAVDDGDGHCTTCGRPVVYLPGIQHKRGRWREKRGLPPPGPRYAVPTRCPDCEAMLVLVGKSYRCPWSTGSWALTPAELAVTVIGCNGTHPRKRLPA